MKASRNFILLITIIILSAMVVILGSDAQAEVIFVAGEVSGAWSADSVIVTDSIYVPVGETLTIMPGVTILVTSYYKFEIFTGAVLDAVGTETDSIKFMPFTEGDRTLGVDFINASNQSIMEYWYISDALTSGVHAENSDITVRNCLIESSTAPSGVQGGGAVELLNGSDALIENNVFRNNESTDYGGAIYCSVSSPEIRGNIIENNLAGYALGCGGGAIACVNQSSPSIIGNVIRDNTVHATGSFSIGHGAGGALFLSGGSNAAISGNIITGNVVTTEPQTTSDGGAIFIANSNPLISNNLIANNEAQGDNGGAFYLNSSAPTLVNNTIVNNVAGDFGGAFYLYVSNPVLVNSILYFNQDSAGTEIYYDDNFSGVTASYSDIEGSWPGIGNLDIDPMFRDMVGGDYHLQAQMCGDQNDSPVIDAGSPEYSDSLVACEWGLGTELSDMGAYGGGQMGPTSIDNTIDTPSEYFTFNNYPNPFNARTTISYQLPVAAQVTLNIYDMLGRKVETLIDNRLYSAGEHQVTWDASRSSSGMYLYTLEIDGYSKTSKMLLIK